MLELQSCNQGLQSSNYTSIDFKNLVNKFLLICYWTEMFLSKFKSSHLLMIDLGKSIITFHKCWRFCQLQPRLAMIDSQFSLICIDFWNGNYMISNVDVVIESCIHYYKVSCWKIRFTDYIMTCKKIKSRQKINQCNKNFVNFPVYWFDSWKNGYPVHVQCV